MKLLKISSSLFFLTLILVAAGPLCAEGTFEGRWEGVLIFKAGQIELDMVAHFNRQPEGSWSATLDLPIIDIRNMVTDEVEVDGQTIRLQVQLEPGDGGGGTIVGHLSADGQSIEGSFDRLNGQSSPLMLERKALSELGPVTVIDLPPGIEGLRERFNAEPEAVRLVLLLSPT